MLARVTRHSYIDNSVVEGATYYYVVRSVDLSFNRSEYSPEVEATASLRTVTVAVQCHCSINHRWHWSFGLYRW